MKTTQTAEERRPLRQSRTGARRGWRRGSGGGIQERGVDVARQERVRGGDGGARCRRSRGAEVAKPGLGEDKAKSMIDDAVKAAEDGDAEKEREADQGSQQEGGKGG